VQAGCWKRKPSTMKDVPGTHLTPSTWLAMPGWQQGSSELANNRWRRRLPPSVPVREARHMASPARGGGVRGRGLVADL
jgi:hypothetical protein